MAEAAAYSDTWVVRMCAAAICRMFGVEAPWRFARLWDVASDRLLVWVNGAYTVAVPPAAVLARLTVAEVRDVIETAICTQLLPYGY